METSKTKLNTTQKKEKNRESFNLMHVTEKDKYIRLQCQTDLQLDTDNYRLEKHCRE
jgi:hypothetical protein